MLQNEFLLVKFGFDTAENEPSQNLANIWLQRLVPGRPSLPLFHSPCPSSLSLAPLLLGVCDLPMRALSLSLSLRDTDRSLYTPGKVLSGETADGRFHVRTSSAYQKRPLTPLQNNLNMNSLWCSREALGLARKGRWTPREV